MRIEIKTRAIGHGSHSIYLEITEDGKRTREALGLYLIPDNAPDAKRLNEAATQKAIAIKSKRMLGIDEPEDYITDDILLVDWMDIYIRRLQRTLRESSMCHHRTLVRTVEAYLKKKRKSHIKVGEFDKILYKGYLTYIKEVYRVKRGDNEYALTPHSLYNKQRQLNQMLNQAVRDGLLRENPFRQLHQTEKIPKVDSEREALTVEELQKMVAEPTHSRDTKEAFMFCCFTGLRLGDVRALKWKDICNADSGKVIRLRKQKKTSKPVLVPLSKTALQWLPSSEGKSKEEKVFNLPDRTSCRTAIVRLAKRVGIEKDICWHTSRHTFATLDLTAGADLYTVSKLLGHSSIATTAIYADVVMDKRIAAVNLTNGLFG